MPKLPLDWWQCPLKSLNLCILGTIWFSPPRWWSLIMLHHVTFIQSIHIPFYQRSWGKKITCAHVGSPLFFVPCFSFASWPHPWRLMWEKVRSWEGQTSKIFKESHMKWGWTKPRKYHRFFVFSCLKEHPDPLANLFWCQKGFPLVLMETMLSCRLSIIAKTMILNGREWFDTFSWVPRSNVGSTKPFFCVDSYRCYRCG